MKETLLAVIQTLRGLFDGKSELKGFDDWDKFVGCIMLLEQLANTVKEVKEEEKESEVVNDG